MLDERIILIDLENYLSKHKEIKENDFIVYEIDSNNDIVSLQFLDNDLFWVCDDYQERKVLLEYHTTMSDLYYRIRRRHSELKYF